MNHLLVTNDFPPKHGGIQSYLWELWRRLPAGEATVLTASFKAAETWDEQQPFRIERTGDRVLLPTPGLIRRVDALADDVGAELVVLDPALPLGLIGPRLRHRYGLVLHGAEITVPGRAPGARFALRHVLRGADLVIAAGEYVRAEAERAAGQALPVTNVPPGVDTNRFRPLDVDERDAARNELGLPRDALLVAGISRLVPRKGFDIVLRAAARVAEARPELLVVIGGAGRDRWRLERVAAHTGAPVRFLGRIDDALLPAAYGCADVFAMLCRNRWLGLEQEGFGIVFLEAAAAGVPQVAGASGGSADAVADGETAFVVDPPTDVDTVADVLSQFCDDADVRRRMGSAARARAEAEFSYDHLAGRLQTALEAARA